MHLPSMMCVNDGSWRGRGFFLALLFRSCHSPISSQSLFWATPPCVSFFILLPVRFHARHIIPAHSVQHHFALRACFEFAESCEMSQLVSRLGDTAGTLLANQTIGQAFFSDLQTRPLLLYFLKTIQQSLLALTSGNCVRRCFSPLCMAHVRSQSQDDGRGTHTAAVQTTTSPKAAKTGCQETSFQYLLVLGATFVPVVHVFMYIQSNTRSSNVRVHQNKTNKHINNVETRLLQCYNQVQYQLHSKRQSMPGDRNIFI